MTVLLQLELAGGVGIAIFENNDLVFILVFRLFLGILYGFFKHYASAHHERLHEQLKDLTDTFSIKKELQKEFDEKRKPRR